MDGDMTNLLAEDDPVRVGYRDAEAASPLLGALFVVLDAASETQRALVAPAVADIAALDAVRIAAPLPFGPEGEAIVLVSLRSPGTDIDAAELTIAEIEDVLARHGLTGAFTGSPAFLSQSRTLMERDVTRAALITVVGVVLFFAFLHRSGGLALLAFVPIGAGIVVGLALLRVGTDRLTLLAATAPTLLVGLGIDYAIYMAQAVGDRMRHGSAKAEAIAESWVALARPLAVGGLTTAAAFLCLLFARLRGLVDLGWAGGLATLGVLGASLVLLPVLLSWCPARWLVGHSLLARPLERLAPWLSGNRLAVAWVGGLVTAAALVGASHLRLQTDNSRLEFKELPARRLQNRLSAEAGMSTAPLVLTFGSLAQARSFAGRAESEADIARVQTIPFAWRTLVVHAAGNPFAESDYERLMAAVNRLAGDGAVEVAGAPVVNARLTELLRSDWPRVLPAVVAALLIVLTIGLSGIRGAFVALVPLACGVAWAAGLLGMTGSLSIMTVAAAPLVLGIGVDDGVHLLHAWRRTGGRLDGVFREAGVAVVATTVSTVIAFGSFAFSTTPALAEFGWQAAAGLTFCLVASLLLMPVVCMRLEPRKEIDNLTET